MVVKTYGIYLAYPPGVDLRAEGLGRYLAEFLKAAQERSDVHLVIAAPSWMRESLLELFDSAGVLSSSVDIITPPKAPLLLRAHRRYLAFRDRPRRRGRLKAFIRRVEGPLQGGKFFAERKLVSARSPFDLFLLALPALPVLALWITAAGVAQALLLMGRALSRAVPSWLRPRATLRASRERFRRLTSRPQHDPLVVRLYRMMDDAEVALLHAMIKVRTDVVAWYCPTAFWPHFHQIEAPRLLCVPDVVLSAFPVGFSVVTNDRDLENFRRVEAAIRGGEHFVTYSEDVKWGTLVRRYNVDPDRVAVIRHGANRLDNLVAVSGFPDNEAATDGFCRRLFRHALGKAIHNRRAAVFGSGDVRFIFYASQFRPNKNVITLLRAYEHLLRRRFVAHKLVLTGHPDRIPEIQRFISEHRLDDDVLCLYGLSAQELAACYHLADLAVNPSLSEGGCPFTFTESLSVNTPVVMARIPVTEEVIDSPDLRDLMLFDAYKWRDVADRIEWALGNRDVLLRLQRPYFAQLAKRTWADVVAEHLALLERISLEEVIQR